VTPAQSAAALALLRECVVYQRVHLAALRDPATRPDRLPSPDWPRWYARAAAVVDAVDGTESAIITV
jgi:hypothetical protein